MVRRLAEAVQDLSETISDGLRELTSHVISELALDAHRYHLDLVSVSALGPDVVLFFWQQYNFELNLYEVDGSLEIVATTRTLDQKSGRWVQRESEVLSYSNGHSRPERFLDPVLAFITSAFETH